MVRSTSTSTSHHRRAHGLSAEQLMADYDRAHPGRVARQCATRVPAPAAHRTPVLDVEPPTAGIPRILLQAFAPSPAVAR